MEKLNKIRNKKYKIGILIIVLIMGIIGLLRFGSVDKYSNKINVKNISTKTNVLSANVSNTEDNKNISKAYDLIEYKIEYELNRVENIERRNVIVNATLSESESKYARFIDITKENIESTLTNNGKEIEVKVNNVKTGIKRHITLKLRIENAPSNFKVNPQITIKEETEETPSNVNVKEVKVKTNSIEGSIVDKENNPVSNVEISINKEDEEIGKTVTKENGEYLFTDLEEGNYEIKIEEDIYKGVNDNKVYVKERTKYDVVVENTKPYEIKVKKYINKVKLKVNGKEKEYEYGEVEKAVEAVKNLKEIEGEITYKIKVKNIGEVKGEITQIKDYLDEGLSFDTNKNEGWELKEGILYYIPLVNTTLESNEEKEIYLKLDIKETEEAKTYLNRVNAKGEVYKKIVYILDGKKYKEEKVIENEKIQKLEIDNENFDGWYTDKKQTIKYDFSKEVTKDRILYGNTDSKKEYEVTFIDDEEIYNEQTVKANGKITKPNDPSKEGYTFKYWSLSQNGEEYDLNERVNRNIILYSVYEIKKYDVEFYDNDELYNKQEIEYNGNIERVENPSKEYFTFKYWSLEKEGEEYNLDTPVTKNIKLYSVYEKNKYTVKFIDAGNVIKQNEVDAGSLIATPNDPIKEGYTFRYWSKELNGNSYNLLIPVTENITLYSVYEINTYLVEFYGENENKIKTVEVEFDNQIDITEVPIVNKEGYDFIGWKEKNSTSNFDFTEKIKKNIKLYSHFEIQRKAVRFDDENRITTVDVNWGEKVNAIESKGKEGYTFKYWSIERNGEAFDFNTLIKGPTTLYAVYEINKYNVNFINDGLTYNSQIINYNGNIANVTNPNKLGYEFKCWSLTENGEAFDLTAPVTENITLYSVYDIVTYHITYHLLGGSLLNNVSNPSTYTIETDAFTLNNPNKEGYKFIGWKENNETDIREEITIQKGSTGDKEFTANYERNLFEVKFIDNEVEYETQNVIYNELAQKPAIDPSKEGYRFLYWSQTLNGLEYNFNTPITEDKTLYSVYEINKYTVTFMDGETIYLKLNDVEYNSKINNPSTNPNKAHNIFKGWKEENSIDNFDFETKITRNIVLYSSYEEVNNPTISHTPTTWTNSNVAVTISGDNDNNTYKYKINNGEYQTYTNSFVVEENCTISAYTIRENVISSEVNHEIDNIDKIKPTINNIVESEITPRSFKINTSIIDNESGLSDEKIYINNEELFSKNYTENLNEEKLIEYTVLNLEEDTNYTVKIVATDKVGNTKELTKEIRTTKRIIISKIIGRNNTLYEDESQYEEYESLREAIEDCGNNQCTIQMLINTTESNNIGTNQDVTIDLNGMVITSEEEYTITNNGKLTVIDNLGNGLISNTANTSIINEGTFTLGINESSPEVSKVTPYIYGKEIGIENNNIFNFYDGKIEGEIAIKGEVTETPYLYNAGVETGETQVATLSVLAEAEVRIKSVYYTKVQDGVDESKKGNYEEEQIDVKELLKTVQSNGNYGFVYDENNNRLINGNRFINNTSSDSYIILDLTSYTIDQILRLNVSIDSHINNIGYVFITEDNNVPAINDSRKMLQISQTVENKDYYKILKKGKKYYIHFKYNKTGTTTGSDLFSINSIDLINHEAKINLDDMVNDETYYFEKVTDSDNNTFYQNNNMNVFNQMAHSYLPIDLTDYTYPLYVSINVEAYSSSSNNFEGYITLKDNIEMPNVDDTEGRYLYATNTLSNSDIVIPLISGQINYIHFGFSGPYHNKPCYLKINSIDLYTNFNKQLTGEIEEKESTVPNRIIKLNEDVDKIEVLRNVSIENSITIDETRDVILDLNGYTLSTTKEIPIINNNGSLTIIDSDYENSLLSQETAKENPDGTITSSTYNAILNNKNAYLEIKEANITIDKSGTLAAIDNYGKLKIAEKGSINVKANNNRGIVNRPTGDILAGSGSIISTSTNNIGILNISANDNEIKGYKLSNNATTSYNFYNKGQKPITISNMNMSGLGIDAYQFTNEKLTINNSTLGTQSNDSIQINDDYDTDTKIEINDSIIKGRIYNGGHNTLGSLSTNLIIARSDLTINNSEFTNPVGTVPNLYNRPKSSAKITNSTINNNKTMNINNEGTLNVEYSTINFTISGDTIRNAGDLKLKNTNVYSSNSSTYYFTIDNQGSLEVDGGNINKGIKNSNSAIIKGNATISRTSGGDTIYNTGTLSISGTSTITSSNRGINNIGTINYGNKDSLVNLTYPKIEANSNAIYSTGTFNYYDGTLKGIKDDVIIGSINEIRDNYDIKVNEEGTLDKISLINYVVDNETNEEEDYVAKINNNKYTTIQKAVNASNNDDTIEIIKKIDTARTVIVPEAKRISINLKGFRIKTYNNDNFLNNKGNITIKDTEDTKGSLKGYTSNFIINDGTINFNDISLTLIQSSDALTNNGVFNLNSGLISSTTDVSLITNNNELNITGGKIVDTNQESTTNLISNNVNATMTINGGEVQKINGGKVVDNYGNLNIISGKLTASGSYGYNLSPVNALYNNQSGIINITGGNFTGSGFARFIYNLGIANISNVTVNFPALLYNNNNISLTNVNDESMVSQKQYWSIYSIENTDSGIMNIDNGNYSCSSKTCILLEDSSSSTIKNANFNFTNNIFDVFDNSTLNIESGNYVTTSQIGLNINGNSIVNLGIKGDLNQENELKVSKESPKIQAESYAINKVSDNATLNFYDGIAKAQNAVYGIIDDTENMHTIITDIDGNIESKYLDKVYVIKNITLDRSYYDIKTAFDDAENNNELQMLKSIVTAKNCNPIVISDNKSLSLDLNGKTITQNNENLITNNGNLIITDSSKTEENPIGNGVIYSYSKEIFINNGTLTIKQGTYKTKTLNQIFNNSGLFNFENGKITSDNDTLMITNEGTVNIKGGIITDTSSTDDSDIIKNKENGIINVIGGTITKLSSTGSIFNNSGSLYITGGTIDASGYAWQCDYPRYCVKETKAITNNLSGIVRVNGGNFLSSNSYSKLIVNNGDSIINNIESNYYGIGTNTSELTLNNVTMNNLSGIYLSGSTGILKNTGTLNITGGSYTSNNGNDTSHPIWNLTNLNSVFNNSGNSIINLNNVTISGRGRGQLVSITDNSKIGIIDSTLTTTQDDYAILYTSTNESNISGSTITSTKTTIINHGSGTININNSSIESTTVAGIMVTNNGKLNIGIKGDISGSSLNVSKVSPNITGKTYGLNINSNAIVNFYDGIINGPTAIYGTISDVEDGYDIVTEVNSEVESKYLDKLPKYINERINKKYYDIEEAISELTNNDTIKVIRNITYLPIDSVITIPSNKTFTLDLAGFTIIQNNEKFLINNGNLTIKDSSQTQDTNGTGTIYSYSDDIIENNGTLTLNSGTLKTKYSKNIIQNNGTFNMNDGNLLTDVPSKMLINNGNVNISGGNITDVYSYDNIDLIENKGNATLNITGGTFYKGYSINSMINNSGSLNITGGIFQLEGYSYRETVYRPIFLTNNSAGVTRITGGNYQIANSNSLIYTLNNSGDMEISNVTIPFYLFGNNSGTLKLTNVTSTSHGLNNTGTLNIIGGNYSNSSSGDYIIESSGNTHIENATLVHNYDGVGTMLNIKNTGTTEIINANVTVTRGNLASNSANLYISGGTYNVYDGINNTGTINLNNVDITSSSSVISNQNGTVNFNSGTIKGVNTLSNTGTGTINIIDGKIISETGNAVYNIGTGTINIGEKGLPINNSPKIDGKTYAIYNTNSSGKINIYDGTLIGETNSTYGVLNEYEPNYKVVTNDEEIDGVIKKVGRLQIIGETERVAVVNSINFKDLQSAVNYSANSGNADITLYKNVTLERDLVNPGSGEIRILLGNFTITKGSYSIDSTITLIDNDGNPVTAAIYKFLANILNIEVNPRNIVIYMMSDGSKLTDEETYKLYKEDKLVTFNNIETGKYKLGNNVEEIGTVNNRIYIEGLGEGSYKLVSSTNKEVTFEITRDKVLGNVREYTIENENRKTSEAAAEYIIQIQTGINKVNYLLIIISILVSVLSLIIINKKKSIKI